MKPTEQKAYSTACNGNHDDRGDHPINCVDWDMARRYCEGMDRRLLTEAEWEYATRGPDGRVYPWGDDEPTVEHLNACGTECVKWHAEHRLIYLASTPLYAADDGFPTTAPVGSFPKGSSRFGPNDVVGNVWEWVADYYADYGEGDLENPKGPQSGEKRVIRGGGFNGIYSSWRRPSFRFNQDPKARSAAIGFRCAMDPRD